MTLRASIFRKFGIAIFGVFILNSLTSYFYWYQSFPWADMVMHFLGGITVGLFFVFVFYKTYLVWHKEHKFFHTILLNSLLFIGVAILWELMEFSVQHLFNIDHVLATFGDSVSDTICGLLGSLVVTLYFFMKLRGGNTYGRN